VYNETGESVAQNAPVLFDTAGLLSGFTFTPSSTTITVETAGIYSIDFIVSGAEASQFAIFVNGSPVVGSTYGSGAGTQQNNGQMIVALSTNDTITLVNYSSNASVTLNASIGGTQINVNASILIERLG
jgi:hypothetical protein